MSDDFPLMAEVEAGAAADVKAVGVAFGFHPLLDKEKSEQEGRKIFRDVEFVKIVVPGDKWQEYFNVATDKDRQKYPRAYEAFKRRGQVAAEGTPIEKWAMISRSEAIMLKALNIFSVEMLAAVHDGNMAKFGLRDLVTKAKTWLANAKDSAAAQKAAQENEALKEQLADLQRQINEMAPKRPGRPPNQPSV